ncbi:hypothetical protein E2562_003037 [Oryza meyeriana var. granulata]|uniref:Uncharacterized protein n=1 Tax=Oryza meyeriana var. granulata TaxID=110450 RepID=A0A6G1DCS6_9ORYZ|nr:hypothetical protein E2562_003037 [Oryza meyeriana var. granulata]
MPLNGSPELRSPTSLLGLAATARAPSLSSSAPPSPASPHSLHRCVAASGSRTNARSQRRCSATAIAVLRHPEVSLLDAAPSPKSPPRYGKSTPASAPAPPPPRASRRRRRYVSARGCRRRFGIDVVASVDAAA